MGTEVVIISTHWEIGAAHMRQSYFMNYLKMHGYNVSCIGFITLLVKGNAQKCINLPIRISTRNEVINAIVNTFILFPSLIVALLLLRPRIVVVSLPDAEPVMATYFASIIGKMKLVIDIRDPQEENMILLYNGFSRLIAKMYRNLMHVIYRKAHAVNVVTPSLFKYYVEKLRRKVYFVPNGADLRLFVKKRDKDTIRKKFGLPLNATLITYTGGIGVSHYYDIISFVKILREIERELHENIYLVLAGPIIDKYAHSIIRSSNDVIYLGVLNKEDIVDLLSASDIGLIPFSTENKYKLIYTYAIPVKFYEYIATCLPVLVLGNYSSELGRLIDKYQVGYLCEPNNKTCIKDAILNIIKTKEKLIHNACKSRALVDRKVGAEVLSQLLSKLF
jgi:glycosyltransferase involved in cell wall biosynthesis